MEPAFDRVNLRSLILFHCRKLRALRLGIHTQRLELPLAVWLDDLLVVLGAADLLTRRIQQVEFDSYAKALAVRSICQCPNRISQRAALSFFQTNRANPETFLMSRILPSGRCF